MASVAATNEEAVEAWNGVLFDRFVQYRHLVSAGLGAHGEEALRIHPPAPASGLSTSAAALAKRRSGSPSWSAPRARRSASTPPSASSTWPGRRPGTASLGNVDFAVGDLQVTEFEQRFDYAFSRMGTMFFANPVPALRNVREALVPGGRLCMVVWRRKLENEWVSRAEAVVEKFVEEPEESDEPTCGPGPFSMGDADVTSEILLGAGFEQISLRRCDLAIQTGRDLDEAVEFAMALGPAGEVIRLAGAEAERIRPEIAAALREALAAFAGPDGVWAPASTWIVSARAPALGEDLDASSRRAG